MKSWEDRQRARDRTRGYAAGCLVVAMAVNLFLVIVGALTVAHWIGWI